MNASYEEEPRETPLIPDDQDPAISLAWQYIQDVAAYEQTKARGKLNAEMHGHGCGCRTCAHNAAIAVNYFDQFATDYGDGTAVHYEVEGRNIKEVFESPQLAPDKWWLDMEEDQL